VPGDGSARALTDFLRWGPKRPDAKPAPAAEAPANDPAVPSKAFAKFLATLAGREAPVLVDLGPVVGSNVSHFGERLGCKLFVEDLYADIERHARAGTADQLPAFLDRRLTEGEASADGILCWDMFDYLDRPAAQALARRLSRMLRPGGALMGFFCTTAVPVAHYTKHVIVDDGSLRHRTYPATPAMRRVMLNRDIIKMFEGLLVSDSFLLKSNTREILFRKQ